MAKKGGPEERGNERELPAKNRQCMGVLRIWTAHQNFACGGERVE